MDKLPIGKVMYWVRITHGKSHTYVAREIDFPALLLLDVEHGDREVPETILSRWAEFYRIDPYMLAWCAVQSKEGSPAIAKAARELIVAVLNQRNLSVAMGGDRDAQSFFKAFDL